jgi:hypothetical protein
MSDISLLQEHLTLAMKAVAHIIRRMQADPRLAYLIGPGSETFDLLTAAAAAHEGFDKVEARSFFTSLKTQTLPPICIDRDETEQGKRYVTCEQMTEYSQRYAEDFMRKIDISRMRSNSSGQPQTTCLEGDAS